MKLCLFAYADTGTEFLAEERRVHQYPADDSLAVLIACILFYIHHCFCDRLLRTQKCSRPGAAHGSPASPPCCGPPVLYPIDIRLVEREHRGLAGSATG